MNSINKIVLNIPHSSTFMPLNTWSNGIEYYIEHWCDKDTDKIFTPNLEERVIPVIFPYSRFFCDAERLWHDPMEEQGQGIFYTKFKTCVRKDNIDVRMAAISAWQSHQYLLSNQITPNTLVMDCHSFPKEIAPEVDVCVGWNNDWSAPSEALRELVIGYFEGLGYKVGVNYPYTNSITPAATFYYPSIMIEFNKKLYVSEVGDIEEEKSKVYKLNLAMDYLYKEILK